MSTARPSLVSPTLSRQLARELIKQILLGDPPEGEALPPEDELARQYAVSRPVVREAVKAVSMLGMVETHQGRPSRITSPDRWDDFSSELLSVRAEIGAVESVLGDLIDLRELLEVQATGLAADRASEADLDEAAAILDEMAHATGDPQRFIDLDFRFHNVILRTTGNRLLVRLFEQLRPLLALARELTVSSDPLGMSSSYEGHRAILEAVRRRSPADARRAMSEHLGWTANLKQAGRLPQSDVGPRELLRSRDAIRRPRGQV